MKKVKVAVPYVQYDVYEVEIDDSEDEDAAVQKLTTDLGDDALIRKLGVKNVEPLEDYLNNRSNGSFVISDEELDEYVWAIGG